MLGPSPDGRRYELRSATAMPRAAGFLWNRKMMIQMTCRGYAVAQFMQPEPARYAHAPNVEAKTFMQPEQNFYAHHPGRFFYIKDEDTGELFSAPYEPVRAPLDQFLFSVGKDDISWTIEHLGLRIHLRLALPANDAVELWSFTITNRSDRPRRLSVYPYFPIGYMSWMNQSGEYRPDLGGVVASCITPYQKVADYFRQKHFKDKTFFLCERAPDAWEVRQEAFEGEGGLHHPSAIQEDSLSNGDARYETPAAVVQYRLTLAPAATQDYRFLFGPAFDDAEIRSLRARDLNADAFAASGAEYAAYAAKGRGVLQIATSDASLDNFVNHWLPRQVYYHGDVNRLTTDPQTRNYLQDNMGMSFIQPETMRTAFLHALSQQEADGAMPDGILLAEGAELKYINQIPHTDHCIWLPIALKAYLDETNDYAILDAEVANAKTGEVLTAFERVNRAMAWLLRARDDRGLSFIAQGDWCDPMNMVGYKGRGVSGWLTLATAYALNLWATICDAHKADDAAYLLRSAARAANEAANTHLWDGKWYARGITDDGVAFGVSTDPEGRIFLNPQSWSILSGAADQARIATMLDQVDQQLSSPHGVAMFAPPYTSMREDIGRVTQKFPGTAENGAVYNHAAVFYIYSLYSIGEADRAYRLLRQMIPGPDVPDLLQRGQLPVFIPNYYRGAHQLYPRTAGRSSQLFNTGTVAWVYRCFIECLCGLRGDGAALLVDPQLPSAWEEMSAVRLFRGATFKVSIRRADVDGVIVRQDGRQLAGQRVDTFAAGDTIELDVAIPRAGFRRSRAP